MSILILLFIFLIGGEILPSPTGKKRGDAGNPRESMPTAGGRTVACPQYNFRKHLSMLRLQLSNVLKTNPGSKDVIMGGKSTFFISDDFVTLYFFFSECFQRQLC